MPPGVASPQDRPAPRPPLLFEALPPPRDDAALERHVDALDPLRHLGVDAVLVPEVLDGEYPTADPRAFAGAVQERLGIPARTACVVAHRTPAELVQWTRTAQEVHGVRDLFLVGPASSRHTIDGPNVPDALRLLRDRADSLGVVTIPTRRGPSVDEPERLLGKQEAGADYAVGQILAEAHSALRLQRDAAALARRRERPLLPILWTLAPVVRPQDLGFLRTLGVHLPPDVRSTFARVRGRQARLRHSHDHNEELVRRLLDGAHGPTGFCISHVRQSNLPAALELVARVRDQCRSEGARTTHAWA